MFFFFFFNETAPTEITPLPQPAALPFFRVPLPAAQPPLSAPGPAPRPRLPLRARGGVHGGGGADRVRSEEHTSELQSRQYLVCRLLLEKKKKNEAHLLLTQSGHMILQRT